MLKVLSVSCCSHLAPQEVHRLLLGVAVSGEDIRPWAAACGSCRTVVPPWTDAATHAAALAPPPDNSPAGALAALLAGGGGGGRGVGRSKSRPTSACGASVAGGLENKSRPGSPTGSTAGGGVGGSSSNGRTSSVGGGLAASLRKGVSFHGRKSTAAALQQQLQAAALAAAGAQPGGGAALDSNLPPGSPRLSSMTSGLLPAAAAMAAATAAGGNATIVSGAAGGGGHGGRHKVTMTAAQQSAHLKKVHVSQVSVFSVFSCLGKTRLRSFHYSAPFEDVTVAWLHCLATVRRAWRALPCHPCPPAVQYPTCADVIASRV